MQVAHVLQWLEHGGGEAVAIELADRQRRRGLSVRVVAFAPGPLLALCQARGIEVLLLKKGPGLDPMLPLRLAAALNTRRIDVVHTHDPQSLVYAALPAKLSGMRVVHTKHGDTVESARRLRLRREAARFVDAFVAVSETTAETARRWHEAAAHKISVISNGVDTERFRPEVLWRRELRAELGLAEDTLVVGTVGRLEQEKNIGLLIRAVAPLLGDQLRLLVVGEGSERPKLERLAAELGCAAGVRFLGRRQDVVRVLNACDVFAQSSLTEGLPLAVLEAMACGVPVVATRVGGLPALIEEGQTGLLVASGDELALREAIAALVASAAKRDEIGAQARRYVLKHHSVELVTSSYLGLYRGEPLAT